jgi:hypothetical protein
MGFEVGRASITALPDNFWSRFIDASGALPSHREVAWEGAALAVLALAGAWCAAAFFRRGDVLG